MVSLFLKHPLSTIKRLPQTDISNLGQTVHEALKGALKLALIHDGLARGLREASKALDRRQAHMCVLNEACEEEAYKKLVKALCGEHSIPLIQVGDGKLLGEWAGLCECFCSVSVFVLFFRTTPSSYYCAEDCGVALIDLRLTACA